MRKVAILMGSESDHSTVDASIEYYGYFGIKADLFVMSAHRNPDNVQQFAENAQSNGYSMIVACAGMAAHLGGVIAAHTTLPVVGVPLEGSALNGLDALYSMVQMPAGVPVATMAIGKAGARNAAVFCAQVFALMDGNIAAKMSEFKKNGCRIL
jgi:5-(carboxyamino)imidazole ribonucleotide mutase